MRVLVVCSGNLCRSPMGEGILRRLGPGRLVVCSAGTMGIAGAEATAKAIAVCAERGVDISTHRSRPLEEGLLRWAEVVLCMERAHVQRCRELAGSPSGRIELLGRYRGGLPDDEIADVVGGELEHFRVVRDRIWESCAGFLATNGLGGPG
jgi:protein-tyrosine phosphatase